MDAPGLASSPSRRWPTGIDHTSTLLYVVAGFLAFAGLFMIPAREDDGDHRRAFALAVTMFAVAGLLVATARAVRHGRRWAWWVTYLVAIFAAIIALVQIAMHTGMFIASLTADGPETEFLVAPDIVFWPFFLVACTLIMRYLARPEAKAWFGWT